MAGAFIGCFTALLTVGGEATMTLGGREAIIPGDVAGTVGTIGATGNGSSPNRSRRTLGELFSRWVVAVGAMFKSNKSLHVAGAGS